MSQSQTTAGLVVKPLRWHLDEVGLGYTQHLFVALSYATRLLVAASALLVHALLPWLFIRTGSSIVAQVHEEMHRPNVPRQFIA